VAHLAVRLLVIVAAVFRGAAVPVARLAVRLAAAASAVVAGPVLRVSARDARSVVVVTSRTSARPSVRN
jgi:hypothetical protein